jgi:DNA adenine methylase
VTIKTPLKWVGSKARLMPQLRRHLPDGKRLVEPFAGSCAVMMNTDYREYLIADANPDLVGFYRAVTYHNEKLIDAARVIFELAATLNEPERELFYYSIREEFNGKTIEQGVARAARFLYLNRHCYGGVCRYNKRGGFNTPYGHYKKPYFPEQELRAFAEKARRATFVCASYDETLQLVQPGDVVYCDPPYIPVTPTANFTQYHTDGFGHDDQERLASLLFQLSEDVPVLASNSGTPQAHSFYSRFSIHELKAPRSIGARSGADTSATELLAWRGIQ